MSEHASRTSADREVVVSRIFEAPRDLVFRAWTDPDQVARWWGPEGFETPRDKVHIELRPGGRFDKVMRIVSEEIAAGMQVEPGTEFPDLAEVVEVVEPELLVLRAGPQPEIGLPVPTTTRIEFEDAGEGRTRVTLTDGPYTEMMQPNAEAGWTQSFGKLDRLLPSL